MAVNDKETLLIRVGAELEKNSIARTMDEMEALIQKENKAFVDEQGKRRRKLGKKQLEEVKSELKKTNQLYDKSLKGRASSYKKFSNYIIGENKKIKKSFKQVSDGIGGKGGFLGKVGNIIGYGAAYKAVQLVSQGIMTAIKLTLEFEQGFASLQARIGATGSEMVMLQSTILDVAGTSIFTTTEITKAAESMGKLGFKAEQLVEILPVVSDVAIALGESLEATGSAIGKVVNTYGLSGDAIAVIGDRMVQAFNNSALSLETFNTAFSYVGATAKASGTSFNQVTAAMEILADRGFKASKIGTGLRKVMTNLAESGKNLSDIIQEINEGSLEYTDIAALMGQIGAAQLYTLADAYDEFSTKVIEGNDAFGLAMERAAIQQSTTSSYWKIIMNNIGSFFADMKQFSKDKTWQESLFGDEGSAGFMESLALSQTESLEMWIATHRDFVAEYKKVAAEMGSENTMEENLEAMGVSTKNTYLSLALRTEEGRNALSEYLDKEIKHGVAQDIIDADNAIISQVATYRANNKVDATNDFIINLMGMDENSSKERQKLLKSLIVRDTGTLFDTIQKSAEVQRGRLKKLRGEGGKDIENAARPKIEEAVALLEEMQKTVCDHFPQFATELGFEECKKKKTKTDKTRSTAFEENVDALSRYKVVMAQLKSDLAAEDLDPLKQRSLIDNMLSEEKRYREGLITQYTEYITKIKAKEEAYEKKRGEGDTTVNPFTANRKAAEKGGTKTKDSLAVNLIKIGDLKIKTDKRVFEASFNAEKAYILKMDELKYQYGVETSKKGREANLKMQAEATDEYYDNLIDIAEDYYIEMEALQQYYSDNGVVDPKLDDAVSKGEGVVSGLKSKKLKAKTRVNKNGETDLDDDLEWEEIAQLALDGANQVTDMILAAGERRLEELKRQAEAELEIIENRYQREIDYADAALEAGIISQEQSQQAKEASEKKRIKSENAINKSVFDAQKKQDKNTAVSDMVSSAAAAFLQAISSLPPPAGAIVGGINSALAFAAGAQNIAAINKRKFIPQKFADGGLVQGASHANGGVPFTVQGQGGYEMEGGEYIVNKEAASRHLSELERINGKASTGKKFFESGGSVLADSTVEYQQSIIDALNKPVRAYVTNQDLAISQSEREALTAKTSY